MICAFEKSLEPIGFEHSVSRFAIFRLCPIFGVRAKRSLPRSSPRSVFGQILARMQDSKLTGEPDQNCP